ncbi:MULTISPECIES: GlxA family transcriptional regulator [Pseudomonas]|jgi:transcriptional regulator GlxA family with amidase domain|uniref:HTH-type transcriptional regulator GlxA n=1 Tax=Pseudomonas wadenswilerensis TaxID=1785161 RepID=A0A380T2M2_9PSED|nr:GlxA family transcriptional regulator [Pseudomonas sp. LF19]SPO67568.1 AraC family transcriptional regulator [Pseudomonas sp. JV241A]SUQ64263.1 HTH-type transcriptional regulator GlxA [Pseudomonas wadenswilerensis]
MATAQDTLEIGVLVYPGAQLAAVHGLTDLFAVANRLRHELGALERPQLRVCHWSETPDRQLQVTFDTHPGTGHQVRAMIIPPSLTQAPSPELLERYRANLRQWHGDGALLVSVCVGVFFIAASGLLDGRPATTHWNFAQSLAERFPQVQVEANLPLLDDGDIITSAGLMAWTDLGLKLVERYLGETLAAETARFLAVERVSGGQQPGSVFSPRLDHGDEAVLKVQHWLQGSGARDVSLTAMADCAGLEQRTFLRRFRSATGLKPTEYCQQVRVGRACRMLEFTNRSIDQIAWGVGYQDPGAFRKVFFKVTGLAPSDYRRRLATRAG